MLSFVSFSLYLYLYLLFIYHKYCIGLSYEISSALHLSKMQSTYIDKAVNYCERTKKNKVCFKQTFNYYIVLYI